MTLYLEASPKAILREPAISKFDWNFSATHIPALFNVRGFGPPVSITLPSSWTWVDHLVSGLRPVTYAPYSDSLRYGSALPLNLQQIVTRRFILQKARYHPLTGSNYL